MVLKKWYKINVTVDIEFNKAINGTINSFSTLLRKNGLKQ